MECLDIFLVGAGLRSVSSPHTKHQTSFGPVWIACVEFGNKWLHFLLLNLKATQYCESEEGIIS